MDRPVHRKVTLIPSEQGKEVEQFLHSCGFCDRSFSTHHGLQIHLHRHDVGSEHQCTQCEKSFATLAKFERHMKHHLGTGLNRCETCEKTFVLTAHLKRHMRIHTGERPFKCHLCEKDFNTSGNLARHIRYHAGIQPYKCDVCHKTFTEADNLHRHRRSHTGEKPYPCTLCGKSYVDSGTLGKHMRSHTGERPYKCEVCEKAFGNSSVLYKHRKTHTSERPYMCGDCGKKFTCSSVLKEHVRRHSGERRICEICGRGFLWDSDYRKHKLAHLKNKGGVVGRPRGRSVKMTLTRQTTPQTMSSVNFDMGSVEFVKLGDFEKMADNSLPSFIKNDSNSASTSHEQDKTNKEDNHSDVHDTESQGEDANPGTSRTIFHDYKGDNYSDLDNSMSETEDSNPATSAHVSPANEGSDNELTISFGRPINSSSARLSPPPKRDGYKDDSELSESLSGDEVSNPHKGDNHEYSHSEAESMFDDDSISGDEDLNSILS